MKLNHECVRDLMLYIEEKFEYSSAVPIIEINLPKYSLEEIAYATKKLKEAGYIDAKFIIDNPKNMRAYIGDITWEGHKFLDTIRDNKVWSTTKKIASKLSSVSLSLISTIASQVLTNIINQQFGIAPAPGINV